MSASNPFRKKAPGAIDTARTGSPKSSMRSKESVAGGDRKNKPVKQVRVLSPPPLSPDSPEWPLDVQAPLSKESSSEYNQPWSYQSYSSSDPFDGAVTDESDRDSTATPPPRPAASTQESDKPTGNVPANPFSKTLQDLEGSSDLEKEQRMEGEVLKAANANRKSLNVDSFKKLLMTGTADDDVPHGSRERDDVSDMKTPEFGSSQASTTSKPDMSDESPSSPTSSESQDVREESHMPSSNPLVQQMSNDKKAPPPPPPSSRHGRSLKQSSAKNEQVDEVSNVGSNKPLPPAPVRRSLDDEMSPFDHEAAGKAPETDADFIPMTNNEQSATSSSKKSAPAPPPPRGHARADTKTNIPISAPGHEQTTQKSQDAAADSSVRSSLDEGQVNQPDGARPTGHAPAPPPPPRRPHAQPKQSSQTSSPSVSSSSVARTSIDQAASHHRGSATSTTHSTPTPQESHIAQHVKSSAAPRPPPARNSSARRPASIQSFEAVSQRTSSEGRQRDSIQPPPPPPPRNRGGSPRGDPRARGSSGASDTKKAQAQALALTQESTLPSKGNDILADLDALQREVDALRGSIS